MLYGKDLSEEFSSSDYTFDADGDVTCWVSCDYIAY